MTNRNLFLLLLGLAGALILVTLLEGIGQLIRHLTH
jgi:hypothetical protein